MIVTFCGHGNIDYDIVTTEKLYKTIEELIHAGADEFLLGGYGKFDILAVETVNRLKLKYPHIKTILVTPYLERKYRTHMYDEIIYPPLENIPRKFAILKRNEWMVDHSAVIIACIRYPWGGALKTFDYAVKNKIKVINIYEKDFL